MSTDLTAAELAIVAAAVNPAHTETRYDLDPRVEKDSLGGLYVTAENQVRYHVTDQGVFGWCVFTPDGEPMPTFGGGIAGGYRTADAAVYRVIGAPR